MLYVDLIFYIFFVLVPLTTRESQLASSSNEYFCVICAAPGALKCTPSRFYVYEHKHTTTLSKSHIKRKFALNASLMRHRRAYSNRDLCNV